MRMGQCLSRQRPQPQQKDEVCGLNRTTPGCEHGSSIWWLGTHHSLDVRSQAYRCGTSKETPMYSTRWSCWCHWVSQGFPVHGSVGNAEPGAGLPTRPWRWKSYVGTGAHLRSPLIFHHWNSRDFVSCCEYNVLDSIPAGENIFCDGASLIRKQSFPVGSGAGKGMGQPSLELLLDSLNRDRQLKGDCGLCTKEQP